MIGYDKASKIAHHARDHDLTLRQAALQLGFVTEDEFDRIVKALSAAADAEDRTEKHAVTPGPLAPARELYGVMLLDRGMAREALAAFEATLKKEPKRLGATVGAARAAAKAGDAVKAKEYYAKVAELTSDADASRSEAKEARAFLAK